MVLFWTSFALGPLDPGQMFGRNQRVVFFTARSSESCMHAGGLISSQLYFRKWFPSFAQGIEVKSERR